VGTFDGLKYETIFGKLILPGLGTAIAGVGALLLAGIWIAPLHEVNEYIQGPFWLLSKIFFFLFFYVWARGTLPRFRYDQLMSIGWKLLLPVSIANVIVTAAFVLFRSAP
jgi:NADH-quinone oxidoreductase subunit H